MAGSQTTIVQDRFDRTELRDQAFSFGMGRPPRVGRQRRRSRLRPSWLAAVLAAMVLSLVTAADLRDLPAPIDVRVQGAIRYLAPGTRFDAILARFGLTPKDGDLMDVEGAILQPGIYPGRVLLNGHPQTDDIALAEGDVVSVIDGKDHVEPLTRSFHRMPNGPADPQFTLATAPWEQVVTRGALSGKVASATFRRTGPWTTPRSVALTFDDGPWPGSSDSVLSILRKRHVPATFFVIGYLAQRYPDQVSAEVGAGMSVGNHTWDHPTNPSVTQLPRAKLRTEITSTDDVLRSIGVRPDLFRPPGGSDDPAVTGLCLSYGLRVVRWSIDPRDWEDGVTAKQIVARVLSNVRPGSIILLHDGGGDQSATVAALPRIIKGIRSRGLGFASLS